MTQEISSDGEEKKTNALKRMPIMRPVASIETSAGRIYLYRLRVRDMASFEKLGPGDSYSQVRAFLPSIGSLTEVSDNAQERVSLDVDVVDSLSDDEIERIASAYAGSSGWQTVRDASDQREQTVQRVDETASAFLMRLIKSEVGNYRQRAKQTLGSMFGSTDGIFDRVRKSASELGATLNSYENLARSGRPEASEIKPIHTGHVDSFHRQMAKQARERAEEMELTRLTGKMTAESAKTLKDLAEAATVLMEQMDKRDRKADRSTRTQITIAVWSVFISAVLALFALIFSGLTYFRDQENKASDGRWQTKLLAEMDRRDQQRSFVEQEIVVLRKQIKAMEDQTTGGDLVAR